MEMFARVAPVYDEWNSQNDYEMWLGEVLLPELEKLGLQKGWALDVGVRGGRAFVLVSDRPDEERDRKIVYIAGHASQGPERRPG